MMNSCCLDRFPRKTMRQKTKKTSKNDTYNYSSVNSVHLNDGALTIWSKSLRSSSCTGCGRRANVSTENPKQLGRYSPNTVINISRPFSTCNTKISNGILELLIRCLRCIFHAVCASMKILKRMLKLSPVINSPCVGSTCSHGSQIFLPLSSLHRNSKRTGKWQLLATVKSRVYDSLNWITSKSMSVCSTVIYNGMKLKSIFFVFVFIELIIFITAY